jgi:hypothetical protein
MLRRFYWQGISQVIFDRLTKGVSHQSVRTEIKRDLQGIASVFIGSSLKPTALYWQIRRIRFWHFVFLAYSVAQIRQRIAYSRPETTPN